MFTIEHNLPKPHKPARGVRKIFAQMKPGDSVLVDMTGKPEAYARKLASRMSAGSPYRFTTTRLDDGNVRIWCETALTDGRRKRVLIPRIKA